MLNPVTFPPGRAKLSIVPDPIGSAAAAITMGIVFVVFLTACTTGADAVTITSTLRFTNSVASAEYRCSFPSPIR